MQKILSKNGRLWIAMFMFVVALVYALQLSSVVEAVEHEAFMGQWIEKIRAFEMVLDEIDAYVYTDSDWGEYDYASHLSPSVYEFDNRQGVFAALYNDDLQLLSRRAVMPGETPFNPFDDPKFMVAIADVDRGEMIAPYPAGLPKDRWGRVYYRWVPTGDQYDDKLLAVVGMLPSAMDGNPGERLVAWCVGLLALKMLGLVMNTILLASERGGANEGK